LLSTNCCCRQLETRRPVFRRAVHLPDRGLEACSLAVTPTSGCYPLRLPPPGCVFLALRASATPMEFLVPSTREHRVARLQAANPSRAVHRVSHPLDGFSFPGTFGLVSCRSAHGIPLFRGFPPPSGPRAHRPRITLLALLPRPVSLGRLLGSKAPRRLPVTDAVFALPPSGFCSDGGSVSVPARFRRPNDRSPPELPPL
jgi:hypothetical protein